MGWIRLGWLADSEGWNVIVAILAASGKHPLPLGIQFYAIHYLQPIHRDKWLDIATPQSYLLLIVPRLPCPP